MMQPTINGFIATSTQSTPLVWLGCCGTDSTRWMQFRPSPNAVFFRMILKRHDLQILNAIVLLVAVLMVNTLAGIKTPSKMLLHDVAMFFYSHTPINSELNVAATADPASAFKSRRALASAISSGADHAAVFGGAMLELVRRTSERLSAIHTCSIRKTSYLPLTPTLNRTCNAAMRFAVLNVKGFEANRACDGFHNPIITAIETFATAKTYSITETT